MFRCFCKRRRPEDDDEVEFEDDGNNNDVGDNAELLQPISPGEALRPDAKLEPLQEEPIVNPDNLSPEAKQLLQHMNRKLKKYEDRNTTLESRLSVVKVVQRQLDDAHRLLRAILRPYYGSYNSADFVDALSQFALLKVEVEKLQHEREQHVKEIGALLQQNMLLQAQIEDAGEDDSEREEELSQSSTRLAEDIDNLMEQFQREGSGLESSSAELFEEGFVEL